jgi:hypothetical protein
VAVAQHRMAERLTPPDLQQQVLDVVEHLDGGGRVVDGRRERPDGDVDQDAEGEGRVLLDGPLPPEGEHAPQAPPQGRWRRPVDLDQDGPVGDEVADRVRQVEDAVAPAGQGQQPARVDRLDGLRLQDGQPLDHAAAGAGDRGRHRHRPQ